MGTQNRYVRLFENYSIESVLLKKHNSVKVDYTESSTDRTLKSWKNHGKLIVSTVNGLAMNSILCFADKHEQWGRH